MRNVYSRGRILRGRILRGRSKEEGGRRNVKERENAWKVCVECGRWNEKCVFARKEEGVRSKEKCESAREARGRKERGHFKLKCPLSF